MPFHVIIEVRAKELVEEQGLGGGTGHQTKKQTTQQWKERRDGQPVVKYGHLKMVD